MCSIRSIRSIRPQGVQVYVGVGKSCRINEPQQTSPGAATIACFEYIHAACLPARPSPTARSPTSPPTARWNRLRGSHPTMRSLRRSSAVAPYAHMHMPICTCTNMFIDMSHTCIQICHTHVYTHIFTDIHVHTCVRTQVHTHVYPHVYPRIKKCLHMSTRSSGCCSSMHISSVMSIHMSIHMSTHTGIRQAGVPHQVG